MAKFTSRYRELTFYVDNERKQFANGVYETDDKQTIEALESLKDVQKVADEPKATKAEAKPKAATKPSGK